MNRVLIVEDDANVAGALALYFQSRDWEVFQADNGAEGLEQARALKPDVILLDVNLPRLSGQAVCGRLKEDPALKHIPVLMMTGEYRDVEDRVLGLDLGADDYLLKPVEPAQLLARAESVLKASRARLEAGETG